LYGQGRVSLALWYRAGFGFQQNLGQKSAVMDDLSCFQHNFPGHQHPQGQGHNKQESTTFIHAYGTSKQHCMGKEEFHWLFGVMQIWFSAKLRSKISSDGSQLLSTQFPWPPTATGT
jgi:hypothetical protein